jgi:20S proteasome alpha/beta subunit
LREKYRENMSIKEGLSLVLNIFKEILGEKFDIERFEAGIIDKEKKIVKINSKKIEEFIK